MSEEDKKEETKPTDAASSPRPEESSGVEAPKSAAEFAEEAAAASTAGEPSQTADPPPQEPDWKDLYARLRADFDNFKKRTVRDREETYRYAESDILQDVLPTVDNLTLALANAKNPEDEFVKGVQLVHDTLLKSLKDHGAEPFDCVGQSLDTEKMEAIATLPSADVEEGKVSNEVKRGWMLKGKVLRVAQVVVSSGNPEE